MMSKKLSALFALATLSLFPLLVLAGGFSLNVTQEPTRSSPIDFAALLGKFIDIVWIIFVFAVVILLIVTAFLFLTTQGDPEKVKKARMALIFCIIGIVVALLGYRMLATINNLITSGPSSGPTGACCTSPPGGGPPTVCNISNSASCAPAGLYQGDGTTCTPNPCL